MSVVTRTVAKSYFETNDKPTESDFVKLIDSVAWYSEVYKTPAELKTGILSIADTNFMSDAQSAKLFGIAEDADVNPTDAEIVASVTASLGQSDWKTPGTSPWTVAGSDIQFISGNIGIGKVPSAARLSVEVVGVASELAIDVSNDSGDLLQKTYADGTTHFGKNVRIGEFNKAGNYNLAVNHYGSTGISKIGFAQNSSVDIMLGWMEMDSGENFRLKTYHITRPLIIHSGPSIQVMRFGSTIVDMYSVLKPERKDLTALTPASYTDCITLDLSGVLHLCDGTAWNPV